MATLNPTTPYVRVPKVNPFRWMKAENGLDDYFVNEIPNWETQTSYLNPYELSDPLNAQFVFDTDEVTAYQMQLINCYDKAFATATTQTMYTDDDGWRYVHFNLLPNTQEIKEGIYYLRMKITLRTSQIEYYITEPICLKTTQDNTVWFDYGNGENDFGMIWNRTGIVLPRLSLSGVTGLAITKPFTALYRMRVPGGYWSDGFNPNSDDVVYNNQLWDAQIVSSIPYNVKTLTIGDGKGVPNYIIDILNRVFSCDYMKINGVQMCKSDDASFEATGERGFPMRAWEIDVMPSDNEYEEEYSTEMTLQPIGIGFAGIGFNFYIT